MIQRRTLILSVAALAAGALSVFLDPWAWHHLVRADVYEHDWGRQLRVYGSLAFWLPLSIGAWLVLRRSGSPRPWRGWLLLLGPVLAGGVAELVKLLVRRERPGPHDGAYVFRSFLERPWDTRDLGFPSSHAMLAFGGAAILARIAPGSGPLAYLLAAGCALTRIWARAHFASDVLGGALLGWCVGVLTWRWLVKPTSEPR